MKGYVLTKPFTLSEKEIEDADFNSSQSKVRIVKSLITNADVLRYVGEIPAENVVLGSAGIGVVSETDENLSDLTKGNRVYIEPTRECNVCYNCKNGDFRRCSDIQVAGEDFDGFLSDFVSASPEKLFALPDSVSDDEALFIRNISVAISIYDKLNIKKGDYVAVIGANNFANIFAQLLIYYQAVPIVMTDNETNLQAAKKSGIYYALGANDNWPKEISSITSGRMTDKVVYVADCNIPVAKAFALASFGGAVAFTGISDKAGSVSFLQAIKKQLDIHFVNSDFGYTAASINVLANKVIDFSNLNVEKCSYSEVPGVFKKLAKDMEVSDQVSEVIVNLI